MNATKETIEGLYGQRLRLRVCGLLIEDDRLLLIRHAHLGPSDVLWAPPGGGVDFGETMEDALIREFREETGLEVRVVSQAFTHEFLEPPLHAIELFFWVEQIGGELVAGTDPEMGSGPQLIQEVRFHNWAELKNVPPDALHGGLHNMTSFEALRERSGLWRNGLAVLPPG